MAASTSQTRFSQNIWNRVEKKFDQYTQSVIDMLFKVGKKEQHITFLPESCKNEIYTFIRKIFYEDLGLSEIEYIEVKDVKKPKNIKSKKGKKCPQIKTADQIRTKQTTDKAILDINIIKNAYMNICKEIDTSMNINIMTSYNSFKFLETKLIAIFYTIKYAINEDIIEEFAYELFIGINKIREHIEVCSQLIGSSSIFKQCLEDLIFMQNMLKVKRNITYKTLFERYPKFTQITKYDTFFKSMGIKPYSSQVELIDIASSKQKSLVLYKTNIGGGKTMTSVSLASYCQSNNKQLIFVCSVEVVRTHIAKALYNAGIGFAIGNTIKNYTSIVRNYNCANSGKFPDVIICDLETAVKIFDFDTDKPIIPYVPIQIPATATISEKAKLKAEDTLNMLTYTAAKTIKANCGDNFITFVDEVTIDSEVENSEITDAISRLLHVAPLKSDTVILSSSTMPSNEEIEPILSYYRKFYGDDSIKEVGSMEVFVGCKLFAGDVEFLPYESCDTCEKLGEFIERMKNTKFVDRLLPSSVAFNVSDIINRYLPDDQKYDLEKYFSIISNLSQTNIYRIIIEMMEKAVTLQNDEIVKEITSRPPYSFVCYKNVLTRPIFTRDYYKYNSGQTIIACVDPIDMAYNMYNNMIADGSKSIAIDVNSIINNYIKRKNHVEKKVNDFKAKHGDDDYKKEDNFRSRNIEDSYNKSSSSKKRPIGNKSSDGSSTNRRQAINVSERVSSMEEAVAIDFPKHLQIGTSYHNKIFYPEQQIKTYRNGLVLESIPLDMQIQDWIYFLLFCGVGIYDPTSDMLTPEYTDLVIDMVSNNQMAFLIAGKALCYGADLPITSVIIEPEFSRQSSINTIFQLLGRAGRIGSSFVAYGHIDPALYKRITNYIMNKNSETITEGMNIVTAFNRYLHPHHSSAIVKHNGHNIEAEVEPLSKAIASNSWSRQTIS